MPEHVMLANGVEGMFIRNTRFKTTRISFNFYLPLSPQTVAVNALLPCVLTSCSEEYRTFTELNRKLKELYGAALTETSVKLDELQCITVAITALCDRYTPDGSRTVMEAAQLLAGLIFAPLLEGERFRDADVQREKRQLIERINGEINDKRTYARNRMISEMYDGLPYGLPSNGTAEAVAAITPEELFEAWQSLLKSAYVRIQAVGESLPDGLFKAAAAAFDAIKRENVTDIYTMSGTASRDNVKRVVEKRDVTQGKLVMGFDSKLWGAGEDSDALTVMADIFGGGPYSRLFENVREKQSLCYYCACSCARTKGMLMVDCGVEAANAEKAEAEILKQLEVMKQGLFESETLTASVRSLTDALLSRNDSQLGIDAWYALRVREKDPVTPEELAKRFAGVTVQQVVEAAKGINLNTVYLLMPNDDNKATEDSI